MDDTLNIFSFILTIRCNNVLYKRTYLISLQMHIIDLKWDICENYYNSKATFTQISVDFMDAKLNISKSVINCLSTIASLMF